MGSEFGVTPDTKPELRLDSVGVFWIVFAVGWTAILLSGMFFLYTRRDMQILRIRGLGLSFAAVTLLHSYWIAVALGYVYGPLMPESAEYWIMGIWFPFGIALFHASNSRFLYVANAQKKYVKKTADLGWDQQRPRIRKTLVARWQMLDYSYKMLLLVGVGMAFQVSLTVCRETRSFLTTYIVLHDIFHVHPLAQVPLLLWHPRHRSRRHRHGGKDRAGSRMGVVAFCRLADILGVDRGSRHPLARSA